MKPPGQHEDMTSRLRARTRLIRLPILIMVVILIRIPTEGFALWQTSPYVTRTFTYVLAALLTWLAFEPRALPWTRAFVSALLTLFGMARGWALFQAGLYVPILNWMGHCIAVGMFVSRVWDGVHLSRLSRAWVRLSSRSIPPTDPDHL